ncbi:hypothetical protein TCAL_08763 [Tigriopus californicus]|uniref:Thioredoxin domain-containing protein n=1 Tax=Tigriopus californicus TaxID=6832 RepID=A0A553PKS3_TIGCA|nr:uncharacterized protein LOC131891060 [Tigriopus californicus]TRY78281.1 hypothetical protein TCAL_08763 [Tigriopus californicus]|eukprot:TCALIF_08763-PA protein Name:"Protein of unknown function" AED:0.00 eAED:0.00 QI:9/1/0.83/1/1/1/6/66/613
MNLRYLIPVLILIHLANVCLANIGKRQRLAIPEVEDGELVALIKANLYVSVLYHDNSKISVKTLSDLELIKGDADAFDVIFVRVQSHAPLELLDDSPPPSSSMPSSSSSMFANDHFEALDNNNNNKSSPKIPEKIIPAVTVVLYKKGIGTRYPGRADRQSALFRWMITQIFCHKDRALDISMEQFDILLRSFRNFVFIAHSQGVKKSRRLIQQISKPNNVCSLVDNTLIVNSRDTALFDKLGVDIDKVPIILNIIHGISIEFTEDPKNTTGVLEWIRAAAHGKVKQVTESNIRKVLKREDLLLILFHDDKQRPLAAQLKVALIDLETLFGLAVVTVSDVKVAYSMGVGTFPAVILFDNGQAHQFEGEFVHEDVAIEIKNWVALHIENREETVIRTIEPEYLKSHPNEFKNVLLKEHKDSIRKLSTEYASLLKQNEKLKEIIHGAMDILKTDLLEQVPSEEPENEPSKSESRGASLSAECGECLASVGQAVWNCGTLEIECIKNTIELGSECFGCICEIFDYWWPDDAPNCFKKEIQKIVRPNGTDITGNGTMKRVVSNNAMNQRLKGVVKIEAHEISQDETRDEASEDDESQQSLSDSEAQDQDPPDASKIEL